MCCHRGIWAAFGRRCGCVSLRVPGLPDEVPASRRNDLSAVAQSAKLRRTAQFRRGPLRTPTLSLALVAGLFLAGCETSSPDGTNAGLEQLRLQQTPAMQRAGLSEECIASLSPNALASIKSASSGFSGPRVNARNVGLGNPRVQERQRIQAIARKECPNL